MRARKGFSLVELIVALTILAGALLTLASFTARFAAANATARVSIAANELVAARLEQVKAANRYVALDSLFEGVEPTVAGYAGFRRNTTVTRVGGQPADSVDYMIVTVSVSHAAMRRPLARSVIIAAF